MVTAEEMPTAATPASMRPSGGQIDSLHGLRFFAAFSILFLHACAWIGAFPDNDIFPRLGDTLGVFGMPLFFVLSGFVIQYNYAKLFSTTRFRWALVEFAGARFARLFPLYLVFQITGITLDQMIGWLGTDLRYSAWLFWAHAVTLTQSWFYIILNGRILPDNGFGVSWSISTEMFFYLVFPLLLAWIILARSKWMALILLIVFAALAQFLFVEADLWRDYFNYWGAKFLPATLEGGSNSVDRFIFYLSPWARVFEFLLGCLTAHFYMKLGSRPAGHAETRLGVGLLVIALAALLFLAVLTFLSVHSGPLLTFLAFLPQRTFGSALPIAVLIFCVARYRTGLTRFLSSTPLVLLGEMSYSIYANHYFILRPFFVGQTRPAFDPYNCAIVVCSIAIGIALTLIASYGTYHIIEVPARRWIRGLVQHGLRRMWGAREYNLMTAEEARPRIHRALVGLTVLVAIVAACAFYQFSLLAWLKPYVTHLQ